VSGFILEQGVVQTALRRARERVDCDLHEAMLERARSGEGLDADDVALLWYSPLSTVRLLEAARAVRRGAGTALETFSPLYITNTCDAECRMCGMRRSNRALTRETAAPVSVEAQLRVLVERGMHAVALLTGEYRRERRDWAIDVVNRALRATQDLGFRHVLINIGSLDPAEFDRLFNGIERNADGTIAPKVTMCTFQETYSREAYAKFMGADPDNPRADFERRLGNFDRAYDAGMRVANPGVLLGLNTDVAFEIYALTSHARHLRARDVEVYLSVPRLRKIAGGGSGRGVSDDEFSRLIAVLTLGLPDCKVVITTREGRAVQRELASVVSVISSGSSAVAPYTGDGARFPLEASQFEVVDQRAFEAVLADYADRGPIENFEPPIA
jgi:2-iminoacetate synthase